MTRRHIQNLCRPQQRPCHINLSAQRSTKRTTHEEMLNKSFGYRTLF
jgi:hypothetical protein